MVGPLGDTAEFPMPPSTLVVPELDGARLLGDSTHELLRRVPAPLTDIFRVGSTAPGESTCTFATPCKDFEHALHRRVVLF